jgi:predicted metal-dependent phosphoesterase TrpH
MSEVPRWRRADLHVHSYHSGHASHVRFLHTRDCYSEPDAVYRLAKRRGMDFVTITDHDRIDGCLEFLNRHPDTPDFFMSEEIECKWPGYAFKIHLGAYGITERIHREIQPLRPNVFEAVDFLLGEGVLVAFNHPLFFYDGQVPFEDYLGLIARLPLVEARNGAMLRSHNEFAQGLADEGRRRGGTPFGVTGGSDAHTLSSVAKTYTEAEGGTPAEFLANVRAGRARVGGRHGSTLRLANEIYGVLLRYWASLAGAGRQELSWRRRTVGIAFSLAAIPAEFLPLTIAAIEKRREERRVAHYAKAWGAWRDGRANRDVAGAREAAEPS